MALSKRQLVEIIRGMQSYGDQFKIHSKRDVVTLTGKTVGMVAADLLEWGSQLVLLIEDEPVRVTETIPENVLPEIGEDTG